MPSGNFGNICAGHVARMMGLPIRRLILATNENDVLDEFFRTGRYRPRGTDETHHTSSPSMDISKASNFERFIFDLTGRDANRVKELWGKVEKEEDGFFDLSGSSLWEKIKDFGFVSGTSSHAARIATIRRIHDQYGLLVDPHTADGLKVGMEHREEGVPLVCLETALPVKFSESMMEAIGHEPPRPAGYQGIENLPQRYVVMNADADPVKAFIAEQTRNTGEAGTFEEYEKVAR